MGGLDLKGMTADQLMSALQKHQAEQKTPGETIKIATTGNAPHIEHAPAGPFPGKKVRGGAQQRTGGDRDRARRFGFTPANVLVLVDGTEASQKAVDAALHYRRRNDHIFFVNLVHVPANATAEQTTALEKTGNDVIEQVKSMISEREIGRWETCVIPSPEIKNACLEYANNNKVDIIFIGTRGIDPKSHQFPEDSMGKWIMENSNCSTMLVRK